MPTKENGVVRPGQELRALLSQNMVLAQALLCGAVWERKGCDVSRLRSIRYPADVLNTTAVWFTRYKNSRHEKQAYMPLQLGSVKGTCAPRTPSWRKDNFPGTEERSVFALA